jgi:hypothetical protein
MKDGVKFVPHGIPANASFHSQVTAGLYPTTFLVNEYGLQVTKANGQTTNHHYSATAGDPLPLLHLPQTLLQDVAAFTYLSGALLRSW